MIKGQAHISIERPIEDIFHYVSINFFEHYPKWSPEVRELEKITTGPVRVGTLARQVRSDEGYRTESTFRVIEYQPPQRIWFESTSDPRYRARYDFEPVNDEMTHIRFTFELELKLFLIPFKGRISCSIQKGSENVVWNLKQLLETQQNLHRATA
jgi:hypothetical protein